ncbi:MFS transporter [Candidatus Dojkabacteria bacterium]|uniref:MFS transporter n=1 Tax=Candidatus Dojkabacteria bacterium TaxID=2099670 RepID=A0A3M0Z3P3_9BACT|nr:MAG: MFS transporter [Candidatus Dojkabacteria bacterium]
MRIGSENISLLRRFGLNKVIFYLTMSDVFTWGLYMVLNSFIGLYLAHKFGGQAIEVVGIGVAMFNFSKGFFQIPIGLLTDKIEKDRDDIFVLCVGNIMMGLPYILLPFITTPVFYYVAMFLVGLGASMNLVNWRKIFAKNLVKDKEGFNYAVYDTTMSASMVFFGLILGYAFSLGEKWFDLIMFLIGIGIISSGFWVVLIYFNRSKK